MGEVLARGARACPHCGKPLFDDMDLCCECWGKVGNEAPKEAERVPVEAYWESAGRSERERTDGPVLLLGMGKMSVRMPLFREVIVGRGSTCDVALRVPAVSRRHVRIAPAEEGALVQDLGARNPARLNGRPIQGSRVMVKGDVLEVCGLSMTLLAATATDG